MNLSVVFAMSASLLLPAYAQVTQSSSDPLVQIAAPSAVPQIPPAPIAPNDWEDLAISTDRNSITPHPNVVPIGVLQVENGLTLERFHRGGSFNVPESAFRLGVLKWTELRFNVPNYLRARGTEHYEGVTDLSVGVKQEYDPAFLKKRGFDFGVIAGMTVPTGSRSLTSKRIDPFVQTVAFQKLGQNWIVGTAHSIFTPSQLFTAADQSVTRRRNVTYQPTTIIYRAIGPKLDLWGEWAANIVSKGKSESIVDFGFLYRPGNRHQIDFRFGFGLTQTSPRAFVGAGYSVVLGKLWGR